MCELGAKLMDNLVDRTESIVAASIYVEITPNHYCILQPFSSLFCDHISIN